MLHQSERLSSKDMIAFYAAKDVDEGEHSSIASGSITYTVTLEINMVVSQKTVNLFTSRHSNTTSGYMLRGCILMAQGHLLSYIHSSIICNRQNMETT